MPLNDAVVAIRSRAESLWPAIEATVPIAWKARGANFTRPVAANGEPLPFLMIRVEWNGGEFMSIGAPGVNLARRQGHIWIDAFIPNGSGEDRAHELAAAAAGMFEGEDFGGVVCEAMQPGGDVDSESGAYFGQSAAIPFDYDETA